MLLGGYHQLEDHREGGLAAAVGLAMPVAHGGEGRLDGVCGARMRPVLGGEVVEGHHDLAVAGQAVAGFRIRRLVELEEGVEGLFGVLAGPGEVDPVDAGSWRRIAASWAACPGRWRSCTQRL